MNGKKLVEKSLSERNKGIINFIVFLTLEVVLKIGGTFFLFLIIGDLLFNYKTMQVIGIGESIKNSAILGFVFGLIPAIIGGICTEILYRRKKEF